jgi:hypothetical protein
VVLAVLEEEQELGALGQERRTFLKETVELRIVETVKMIRKVCNSLSLLIIWYRMYIVCQDIAANNYVCLHQCLYWQVVMFSLYMKSFVLILTKI